MPLIHDSNFIFNCRYGFQLMSTPYFKEAAKANEVTRGNYRSHKLKSSKSSFISASNWTSESTTENQIFFIEFRLTAFLNQNSTSQLHAW